MPRGPRVRIARGIYRDRGGIDAYVWLRGLSSRARFARGTPLDDIKGWQDKARTILRRRAKAGPRGPFQDDAARYLKAVGSMTTFNERRLHIADWCAVFGHRDRDSLTPGEIQAQLETWKRERGLSASALNHRRTALQHLYRTLDGKSAPNPVRDVPRLEEPEALPRGLPWPLIRAILREMPADVTRLRLAIETWTGLPHATLARLGPGSVDFTHRTLARPKRHKGKGTTYQVVPLTRRALWYFRLMARCNGWGPFDRWETRRAFQAACAKVEAAAAKAGQALDLSGVRPYDLRHSFGAFAYDATHDLAATAVLLGHSSLSTTRRYTLSAVPAALRDAVAKIEAKTGKNLTPAPDPN